jgi:acyl-CoA synthetase (AMP-forming)/AMP-acid ligase II
MELAPALPSQARLNPWREILHTRLLLHPPPVWVFPEASVSGPTIWVGLRGWVKAFRTVGLQPGDRLVVGGPPGLGWVGAVLAGLWLEATLCLVPQGENVAAVGEELDARLILEPSGRIDCDRDGQPTLGRAPRAAQLPRSPEARFLLRTSGTGDQRKWIALSDANLLAVLRSHLPVLGLNARHRLLSTLPWSHAFGLVLEFLAALCMGTSLVRCSEPRDADEHVRLLRLCKLDWWNAVPAMVRRLAEKNHEILTSLRGGIVGGAAIESGTSTILAGSALRVGYGQTEASPGLLLGAVGEFVPGLIGRPVGCQIRLSSDDELEFTGHNACLGHWSDGIVLAQPDRWVATGDTARKEGDRYFFLGRRDDQVRLENGRTFSALVAERTLRRLCADLSEVMVWSPDGIGLAMAFTGGAAPDTMMLAEALGALIPWLRTVRQLNPECWRYTPKGDVDRTAMRRRMGRFI